MFEKNKTDNFPELQDIIQSDKIAGEMQIGYLRIFSVFTALVMILAMYSENLKLSASECMDFITLCAALIYTLCIFIFLKKKKRYKRYIGFVSSMLDVFLVSMAVYFTRFGADSSAITITVSGAFAAYLPVILFSLRRHDPRNTLFTGILAGLAYLGIILVLAKENVFGVILKSDTGIVFMNDIVNEFVKVMFLVLTGFLGYFTSKNHDQLFFKGIKTEKEKEHIKTIFGRYVSPELVDKILNKKIPLEGEKREITIMFIDIRNFTPMCEKNDPKRVVDILNNYFDFAVKIISKYNGFVDKFMGDEIMVEFGAPNYFEDHREKAVECALELQRAVKDAKNSIRDTMNEWALEIGIGINTGEVILGNIGAQDRVGYTAMGDTVNAAFRIERLTRELKEDILIGESVYIEKFKDMAGKPFTTKLKGKIKEMQVYPIKLLNEGAKKAGIEFRG